MSPPTPDPIGLPRNVFVGRERGCAWLQERFEAAVGGAGSVSFVTGERGVGKTTLVGDFLRRVRAGRPVTLVAGRCVEQQGPREAFLPYLDAVGRLLLGEGRDQTLELLRTYAPTICVQLPAALLPDPEGLLQRQALGATKERLIRECGDFLEAASRAYPVVMLLEDLQWADPPSVELLVHLGRRIARQRTLILGTYRDAEADALNPPLKRCALDLQGQGLGHQYALGSFRGEDVKAYLDARFDPNRFPAGLSKILFTRSEGLPLFVRSLVDLLVERGEITRAKAGWKLDRRLAAINLEPNKGLQDLVRQHIETLPEQQRELLRHASIAGNEFLSPVVAGVAESDELEVEELLHQLSRVHGLIEERGQEELPDGTLATRYRFVHSLYQWVLYQDLVPRRRALLHLRVAERLRLHWGEEAPQRASEIAEHYELGRDALSAAGFRILVGDNAARRYAYLDAERQYDRALELLEKLAPEQRLGPSQAAYEKRGAVKHAQARFDDAATDYSLMLEAARAASHTGGECAALSGLCRALFFARRIEEMAIRACEAIAAAKRAGSESRHLEARSRLAQVLVSEGSLTEAVPLLDDVIDAARRQQERPTLLTGLAYRGFTHYWQSEYGAAETHFAEGVGLAEDLRDSFEALAFRMFLGLCRSNLGQLSLALDDFEEAIAFARLNGDRFWLPRLISHVGWIHRELHAFERAHELDAEALRIAREVPVPWAPESEPLFNLCRDHARAGRREDAVPLLEELEEKSRHGAWFPWMHDLRFDSAAAEHWLALGDMERAAGRAARLRERAERLGARAYVCAAERLNAEIALAAGHELGPIADSLRQALEALNPHPAPLEAWKAARALGRVCRALNQRAQETQALALGVAAVRAIAAGVKDEKLRTRFLVSPEVGELLASEGPGGDAALAR